MHFRKYLPKRFARLASRQKLSLVLVIVGIALLGYTGFWYGSMYASQKRLERAWEQQNSAPTSKNTEDPAASPPDGLTRLSIPKINLDAVVVEGVSYRQLAIAPGHLKDTPAPGENGNSVISAHRDTFFRHIYELQKGDSIVVRRNGHTFTYEVTGKKIVEPDDVSVLRKTNDAELTLVTCYPTYYIGPAPERLAVFSKLTEQTPASTSSTLSGASAAAAAH